MRKPCLILLCFILTALLFGCAENNKKIQIAATTLPVYEFTEYICQGTDISVVQLITEEVSCLHDYSLQVRQMQIIEESDAIIVSGAGLEDFLNKALLTSKNMIDASSGITLLCPEDTENHIEHHDEHTDHTHNSDPHIWLSPKNASVMVKNIANGLIQKYPEHQAVFYQNMCALDEKLQELSEYGQTQLSELSHREIITFHDGFAYLAAEFHITILHTVEEESGSEASAQKLVELIKTINFHQVPAIFTEKHNKSAAASIISNEIGIPVFQLDTALSTESYFTAMYHNIDTLKEALK